VSATEVRLVLTERCVLRDAATASGRSTATRAYDESNARTNTGRAAGTGAVVRFRYQSKLMYCAAIQELQIRARRSGWRLETAGKAQLASWLGISPSVLDTHNRAFGISLDDIRAGRV
jgi:hypothetical protein